LPTTGVEEDAAYVIQKMETLGHVIYIYLLIQVFIHLS